MSHICRLIAVIIKLMIEQNELYIYIHVYILLNMLTERINLPLLKCASFIFSKINDYMR